MKWISPFSGYRQRMSKHCKVVCLCVFALYIYKCVMFFFFLELYFEAFGDVMFCHSCWSSHRTSGNKPPEMTLERAVNLLTQEDNEETLIYVASLIQDQCLKSIDAKRIVGLTVRIFYWILFAVTQNRICLKLDR